MLMGAHHAFLVVRAPFQRFLTLIIIYNLVSVLMSQPLLPDPVSMVESQALVKFKASLQPVPQGVLLPNWNLLANPPPCLGNMTVWIGIICYNGRVWGLQFQRMGLAGSLDFDSLMPLSNLRILSIFNNNFQGPLPDLRRIPTLRLVFFSNNRFSGNIPDDAFLGMNGLRRLFLSNNAFTGRIPSSLTKLNRLVEVRLEGNRFQGNIPNFTQEHVPSVNVSNNQLEGSIPMSLGNLSADSFSGNKGLCGPPLELCPDNSSSSSSKALLIAILVVVLLLVLIILCCIIARRRKASSSNMYKVHDSNALGMDADKSNHGPTMVSGETKSAPRPSRKVAEVGKLIFVRDDTEQFDLAELLRASAEVLGSGHFGSSYKAVLPNGKPMVVKRFRHMNRVVRHDFHDHVMRLGKLQHPNILPLVAYYYRREEKLFVLEFVMKGSLASKLHGSHKGEELNWTTRLKIIQGVAKGLAYLHNELHYLDEHVPPHGHLKSSNVLLNDSFEPFIMDYGLIPLVNLDQAQQVMLAYKSPDFSTKGNIFKKTDVWCLGILILEILTGKFPTSSLTVGKDDNLESWVDEIAASLGKSTLNNDVFDKDMSGIGTASGEVRKLLHIGLSCCEKDVNARIEMEEAVRKIGEVKW